MPKIELALPGTPRTTVEDIAETYRITVERLDGIACSEMEGSSCRKLHFMMGFSSRITQL